MSIKFFSGLQDLLGLYDSSIASSTQTASSVPSSSSLFSSALGSSTVHHRRKSVGECKQKFINSEDEQITKCSHERKVWFDDNHLISGYCEASTPLFNSVNEACHTVTDGDYFTEILMNYRTACKNLGIPTIVSVERQIERFNPSSCKRQELLSLKGETVSAAHMEALEEIFRKVQFDTLDFEYTFLDDDAAIALSEMLEFYESAQKLNLSFNKQITIRGWHDLFKAVKNSSSLQMLNLRYTSLSEKPLSALCRVLRGTPQPILSCLHLENVNLHGRNLCNLVCALKFNTMLKELYLGENNLQSTDGTHLHHLIINNSTLQMLDLRNNQLTDAGLVKICEALRNPDVIKNSSITALVLWNNKLTGSGMDAIAGALCTNFHLETLNIGSNMIGELGIQRLKSALGCNNSNLRRLGLQNTQMNCQSTILLAECLADNTSMVRVDLRDNPGIGSAGLLALHSAMKINSSISLLNLDQSCVVTTNVKVRPYQENFRRYYEEIKEYCERNRLALQQSLQTGSADEKITSTPKIEESVVENGKPEHSKKVLETVVNVESPSYCHLPTTETNFGSKGKFLRSSSLTCNETVSDIHERIRVMGGSTHSLDEINNDSTKTIKRCAVTPHNSLGLAEWSSLPAIPQTCLSVKPTVRKLRRFSISPSSSSFDVTSNTQISTLHHDNATLSIASVISVLNANPSKETSSSSVATSSKPNSKSTLISPPSSEDGSILTMQQCTSEVLPKLKVREPRIFSNLQECSIFEAAHNSEDIATSAEMSHNHLEYSAFLYDDSIKDVRVVVNDLVNYVVYEENAVIERKRSLLLQTTSFPVSELVGLGARCKNDLTTRRISLPRIVNVTETVEETEDSIVAGVVRTLVREILRLEKEDLRNTLDRRRKRSGLNLPSNLV